MNDLEQIIPVKLNWKIFISYLLHILDFTTNFLNYVL